MALTKLADESEDKSYGIEDPNLITNEGLFKIDGGTKEYRTNKTKAQKTPGVKIIKFVDGSEFAHCVSGDVLTYTFECYNDSSTNKSIKLTDYIDVKTTYITGSLKVDGVVTTPTSTNPLTVTFPIPANSVIIVEFKVTVL